MFDELRTGPGAESNTGAGRDDGHGEQSLPIPDDVSTEAAARSFVETPERRYVHNDPVDGFGTTQPATETTVDASDSAVVDRGNKASDSGFDPEAVHDFETPPNYDQPDQGGHEGTVRVSDAAGEVGLDRDYRPPLPPTVQPRATRPTGAYSLSASTTDGGHARYDWSPSGPTDPARWALAVLITHGDDVAVRTLYPNAVAGVHATTPCTRMA